MARKKMNDENTNASEYPDEYPDPEDAVADTEPAANAGQEIGVADVASGVVERAPTSIGSYTPSVNDQERAGIDDPSRPTAAHPSENAALQTNAGETIGQDSGGQPSPADESITLARTAYLAHRHFQNYHSNKHTRVGPIPDFDRLPQDLRLAWEAAARQVRSVLQNPGEPIKPESRWAGWAPPDEPPDAGDPRISWNPYTKTVMNHSTGEVDEAATNKKRAELGLKVPWSKELGSSEVHLSPVYDQTPHQN